MDEIGRVIVLPSDGDIGRKDEGVDVVEGLEMVEVG